jgi:hypothetical protein
VLQLSDNDARKQGLVISVANNLMKFYDPDKVAVEIVAFGPGIELLKPDNPSQTGRKPGRAGRPRRHLPQHRRYDRARHREAAGVYCRRNPGPGRRRADPAADGKRVHAGPAVTRCREGVTGPGRRCGAHHFRENLIWEMKIV